MRSAGTLCVLAACGFAAWSPLHAQRVRGALSDSATREAITGAVITISDSAGKFLSRGITSENGKFAVPLLAGSRQMRIVRIGYRPRDVTLGAADTVLNLRMQPVPSMLAPVETAGQRVCPGESTRNAALDLWEQARAGLLAAVVSRESHPPTIRMRSRERTLEPIRRRVVEDSTEIKDVAVERSYVAARPAWAFALHGYMREDITADREYFAPDEAVLLDPSFAATHCMRIVKGLGPREAEIGLGFEPVKDAVRDTMVDISGVLWLERAKLELDDVEFRYTNLEPDAKGSGGEIDFSTMPNGAPMITRWTIHSAILAYDDPGGTNGVHRTPPPRPDRVNARLVAYRESSGMVGFARWTDGSLWHGDMPRAIGTVTDLEGKPVAGAKVWLQNTRDTATTDIAGAFYMPFVFQGIYVVLASDTTLAAQGIARTVPARVGLFDKGDTELRLLMHPRSEVLPLLCPEKSYKPGTGVLIARVVDADGKPAAHARVDVIVQQLVVATDTITRNQQRIGEAGDDGKFTICGASLDRPLLLRASRGANEAAAVIDRWTDELAAITLTLRPRGG